jgi:hypothetical protein
MNIYNIVRMYANTDQKARVVHRGLTLEQAQAHCKDPNTSSRTANKTSSKAITKSVGEWFDGYDLSGIK